MIENGSTEQTVYCGVVVVNAVMAGLNMLLLTWLSKDRKRADEHKRLQYQDVMTRMSDLETKIDRCPALSGEEK